MIPLDSTIISRLISLVLLLIMTRASLRILHNLIFSSLKIIPGPLLFRAAGLPLLLAGLTGNRTSTIHKIHLKYGPVVRIGPNELSFSGINHVNDIYGQSSVFLKAPIYKSLARKGIFSMRKKEDHRARRKLLSHAFAHSTLLNLEPLIVSHVQKLSARISETIDQPLDVLYWFRMLALDIVGELFLGKSFDALENDHPLSYAHDLDNFALTFGIEENWPFVAKLLRTIGPANLTEFLSAHTRVYQFGADAYYEYIARNGRSSRQKDLLCKMIEAANVEKGSVTDDEIADETSNLIFAGTDTTSTTLTYLFWVLARSASLQDSLYQEIKNFIAIKPDFKSTDLAGLKTLDAVIKETLRVYSAAPSSLQRITPSHGGRVDDVAIPPATIVSMQCFTTHRDSIVFPKPDCFDPDRWLKTDGGTTQMKEMFMPFTKGPRTCLGKNLALMEMKLITVLLLGRYSIKVAAEMTVADMDMRDHFLLFPKGKKFVLQFSER
ncbi:cytochrome P450 [Phlyctema vagabunda]|uniref:Cytochrome P450 n=1 Tax=Phlyctema vagabunda TaxID=108571 RepID=A0ABR4PKL5_9HELO